MPAPDVNCTDSRAQDAPSPFARNQDDYGYLQASSKRAFPVDSFKSGHDRESRPTKRLRINREDTATYHQPLQNKSISVSRTYLHQPAPRPLPPSIFSSAQKTPAMLNPAEDTGGTRTLKHIRSPGSGHGKTSSKSLSRGSNIHSDRFAARRGEKSTKHGTDLLSDVGIVEILQQDERPTFIVDLGDPENASRSQLKLLFANSALNEQSSLLESIESNSDDLTLRFTMSTPHRDFKLWVLCSSDTPGASQMSVTTFMFAGFTWKASTIRKYLRIIHTDVVTTTASRDERHTGPNLQQLLGPGSSSPGSWRDSRPEAGSYFDSRMIQDGQSGTPGKVSVLYQDSLKEQMLESSPEETLLPRHGVSPTANGGLGISDILTSGTDSTSSAMSRNAVSPVRPNGEGFGTITSIAPSEPGFFDWTRVPVTSALPPHIQLARSVDWGATSLGPIDQWSLDLRAMCNLIMASPHPAAMYWGPEYVAIYNEAYIALAGKKHPELMGRRYADVWFEIWSAVADVFANALSRAEATMKDDDCLFMQRNGFLEETYFSWSIIPLIGADGSVVGLYNPAFEKTRRKIAERRMLTLREIGEKIAIAREISQFWGLLIEGLQYNEFDAPLVLVYSLADDSSSDDGSSVSSATFGQSKQCILEGTLGISSGHPAAPERIDLKSGKEGFVAAFRLAMTSDKPIVLSEEDHTLDTNMLDGIEWRGWGDPSRTVVICPVRPTTGESTLGFLVMCTNPRRPYDEDYSLFVQLLGRQLATSIASVVLFEEEIRRGEQAAKLAAQDRIELSTQLAARTQEVAESEIKFTRMAELVPVGMFIGDRQGQITYCNDAWYDIAQHPRGEAIGNKWASAIHPEDLSTVERNWEAMLVDLIPISVQFRFKHPWRDKNGNTGDTWVLANSYPEKGPDGKLKSIFGSVTDISSQKFAEDLQKRRMEEAIELKRQQENFIDITSHEMRNPLSAMLQCADEISTTLSELRTMETLSDAQAAVIDSNIDAAQTVILCAQHQKRIVDDVLTLSKLDSAMLLVTPVDVQPTTVVQRALKMFEGELQTADIILEFRTHESFHSLRIDWVRLDPSRLLQVLINLTTNAIKFTTTQEKRTIIVHLGASKNGPTLQERQEVMYIPMRNEGKDTTASSEWGDGEVVYIHFAVQDTGRGLTDTEKKLLFQRFSQGSPRTHVTYGGSGLGLFISRELVELQGGEIGVSSEAGKGSTFAFYVKVRRSSAPAKDSEEGLSEYAPPRKGSAKSLRRSNIPTEAGLNITLPSLEQPLSSSAAETLKILVVEDNLVNQKVLAKQLRTAGCIVYLANHGGEAIERVKESRFWKGRESDGLDIHVILMDLEMPVMDGITAARKIRDMQLAGDLVRHIPVIAVTANAREEQIKVTLEAGIDDVMAKPFRIAELLPKVRDLMARLNMTAQCR